MQLIDVEVFIVVLCKDLASKQKKDALIAISVIKEKEIDHARDKPAQMVESNVTCVLKKKNSDPLFI